MCPVPKGRLTMSTTRLTGALALAALVALSSADSPRGAPLPPPFGPECFQALTWRNLGPNRGGRSIAVAGSATRPLEYYFGATGGGLWKTTDGGQTWAPVTNGK